MVDGAAGHMNVCLGCGRRCTTQRCGGQVCKASLSMRPASVPPNIMVCRCCGARAAFANGLCSSSACKLSAQMVDELLM